MLNIRKKYSVAFVAAISPGKINEFFKAENEFETTVLLEIRRRQMQGRQF
jgi:hypothetical protein